LASDHDPGIRDAALRWSVGGRGEGLLGSVVLGVSEGLWGPSGATSATYNADFIGTFRCVLPSSCGSVTSAQPYPIREQRKSFLRIQVFFFQ
jgi:hypothetical protein